MLFSKKKNILSSDVITIRNSTLFDEEWYRCCFDIKDQDPIEHYLQNWKKFFYLDPAPNFSSIQYLYHNKDVLKANFNPFLHYIKHGRKERRNAYISLIRVIQNEKLFHQTAFGETERDIVNYFVLQNRSIHNKDEIDLNFPLFETRKIWDNEEEFFVKLPNIVKFYLNGYETGNSFLFTINQLIKLYSSINGSLALSKESVDRDLKIFIATNKNCYIPKGDIFYPVQTGSSSAKNRIDDYLHDDVEDNISDLNFSYCELTAQYWAWKNIDAEYYGFFHNRRYLSPLGNSYAENIEQLIPISGNFSEEMARLGISSEIFKSLVSKYDVIVPRGVDVSEFSGFECKPSIKDQFVSMAGMVKKDLDTAIEYILNNYPQYKESIKDFFDNNHIGHFRLMYIMRKEIFRDYCEWIFPILNKIYIDSDFSNMSQYESRSVGMVAERLFGLWLFHHKKQSNFKHLELPCTFSSSTDDFNISPDFSENNVPIVIPINASLFRYVQILLLSLLENITDKFFYDIIFIVEELSSNHKNLLIDLIAKRKNISLRYIDIGKALPFITRHSNLGKNIADYYQLICPFFLKKYDKIICLSPLSIIKRDVSDLLLYDIKGKYAAAVEDVYIQGNRKTDVKIDEYITETLSLESSYRYFANDVIVLNLEKIRNKFKWDKIKFIIDKQNWINGQKDLENYLFNGNILYIEQSWGVRTQDYIAEFCSPEFYSRKELYGKYKNSKKIPWIICGCKGISSSEDFYLDFRKYERKL